MPDADRTGGARPRLKAADRKREILEAAAEVFASKGYEHASVAEIAARVGIVEGAVFRHFSTKRNLLFETLRAFYAPVVERNRDRLEAIPDTRGRLRFLIGEHLRAFAEQPGICRLIMHEVRPYEDYRDSVVYELNREATELALGVIEQAMQRGEFRRDLPAALVRDMIYGGIEHVMWRALSGGAAPDVERLADELTDLIIAGVGRPQTDSSDVSRRRRDRTLPGRIAPAGKTGGEPDSPGSRTPPGSGTR